MTDKLKKILIALIIITSYFLIDYVIVAFVNRDNIKSYADVILLNVIKLFIVFIIILILDWKKLKNEIVDYKNKHKKVLLVYLKKVLYGFLILLLVKVGCSILSSNLVQLFGSTVTDTENQQLIESLLGKAPGLMILSACVLAPIVEELVFRGAIRKVLKNKGVFIAVSGITFGLVHITGSYYFFLAELAIGYFISELVDSYVKKEKLPGNIKAAYICVILLISVYVITQIYNMNIIELINDIPYIGMGMYLAYTYSKEENISINILIHALNNILGVSVLLLMK